MTKVALTFNLRSPHQFIALGFGSGLFPVAPGTAGTLAAVPIVWLMQHYLALPAYLLTTLLCFLVGIYVCGKTAEDVGVHDHGAIVWDEVVGLMITMLAMPVSVSSYIAGFILFRLFDIIKPWPIKLADRHIHGGFGIMFDDVLAGLMALACMHGLVYFGWIA